MSFFKTSDGKDLNQVTSYESGGGFAPIPQGTKLKVLVESANWKTNTITGLDAIKTKARVVEGEFENRVIFDTLDVCSSDTKRRDKHLNKFAAIDNIAGTNIVATGEPPTDEALYGWVGTVLVYTMGLFQPKPNDRNANPEPVNYVMGIGAAEVTKSPATSAPKPARPAAAKPSFNAFNSDDDIPF